jgi:hypothetical protein
MSRIERLKQGGNILHSLTKRGSTDLGRINVADRMEASVQNNNLNTKILEQSSSHKVTLPLTCNKVCIYIHIYIYLRWTNYY